MKPSERINQIYETRIEKAEDRSSDNSMLLLESIIEFLDEQASQKKTSNPPSNPYDLMASRVLR
jgi:hypothetical protein